ncbi:MAG: nuclear transport factor 2 family protein [Pseudomonadales bacterium]
MTPTELFFDYAAAFEQSYDDDDWSRVYTFFHDDAVYEIIGGQFACVLRGPKAIFVGMKKSLDGFDRRFDSRKLAADSEFVEDGSELSVSWHATYNKEGLPQFVLPGKTVMRIRDSKIEYIGDQFPEEAERDMAAWVAKTGYEISPAYD